MTLGVTTYVASNHGPVCSGPCDHPACGIPADEWTMLGELIRKGDTDALALYMSPDLDAEVEACVARRKENS